MPQFRQKKFVLPKNLKEKIKLKSLSNVNKCTVQKKNTEEKEEKSTDTKLKNSKCFNDMYIRNMDKVKSIHTKLLMELKIQKRSRGRQFIYLRDKNYFIFSSDDRNVIQINRDGKRLKRTHLEPKYPLRLTFFNGGKAHFPYDAWNDIFKLRSFDICNNILTFDNEIAHSNEGIKLFFELDYRTTNEIPSTEEILQHVYELIDLVQKFYRDNSNSLDFSAWVLLSTPKPKYVKNEIHPIIAMGCHLVFRNIVVNCEQAIQICHSANLQIESKFGLTDVVDLACYKKTMATLRPIYCRKLEVCFHCLNDDDLRLNCEKCFCRGRTPSGSIYSPSFLINNHKKSVFSKIQLEEYIKTDMVTIIKETSIIPCRQEQFTAGFCVPDGFPNHIPVQFRSKNKDDVTKSYIFKKDRNMIGRRKNVNSICDKNITMLLRDLIKDYHPGYNHDTMLLSNVSISASGTVFVDLKGYGRSFCRIMDKNGAHHKSNRVYFVFCTNKLTISQHCYDTECKKLITSDNNIKNRITSDIPHTRLNSFKRLICDYTPVQLPIKSNQNGDKYDEMMKFLYA